MRFTRPRKLATGAAVLLAVGLAAGINHTLTSSSATTSDPSAATSPTTEVQSRQFRSVVTLDAAVARVPQVPIRVGLAADAVDWEVADGEGVDQGRRLGVLRPTDATPQQTEKTLDRQIALATSEYEIAAKLADLDVEAAKRALAEARKPSAPEAEAASTDGPSATAVADAEDALTRAKLTRQQLDIQYQAQRADLNAQRAAASEALAGSSDVISPSAGVVQLSGDTPTIQPDGYLVTASVPPILLYRLTDARSNSNLLTQATSTVQITGGPSFACSDLGFTDQTATTSGAAGSGEATGSGAATAKVTCKVPPESTVFAGLAATLAITVLDVPDATVVAAEAVRVVDSTHGVVTVVGPDGREQERQIEVGATDGLSLIVVDGVEPGERVRVRDYTD